MTKAIYRNIRFSKKVASSWSNVRSGRSFNGGVVELDDLIPLFCHIYNIVTKSRFYRDFRYVPFPSIVEARGPVFNFLEGDMF